MTQVFPVLNAPLNLPNGQVIGNRIAKAAMTEGLADPQGRPTAELIRLYERWGASGCGVLITGNVLVDRWHLERPGNVIIDQKPDAMMHSALARWATAAKAGGAKLWMQISHAGRQTQATVNPHPKAPSAVTLALPGKQFGEPVALLADEIAELVKRYATAARAAQEAGFDGVQIHAAHGYLLSSFLNPLANHRQDQWGGALENRARMLLDVVRATRAATGPDFTVAVKLNSADFQKGGFSFEDSAQVVKWLEAEGVDLIEISGGNYEQPRLLGLDGIEKPDTSGLLASTAAREGYFAAFAAQMRKDVSVPLMVTGGFRTAGAMQRAIGEDGIAMIGIGRPLCVQTDCVKRLLVGEIDEFEKWETRLRIGAGWLGPQSSSSTLRMLNGFGATYWYYQQFRRFGRGQEANTKLSVLRCLFAELGEQKRWLNAARAE